MDKFNYYLDRDLLFKYLMRKVIELKSQSGSCTLAFIDHSPADPRRIYWYSNFRVWEDDLQGFPPLPLQWTLCVDFLDVTIFVDVQCVSKSHIR